MRLSFPGVFLSPSSLCLHVLFCALNSCFRSFLLSPTLFSVSLSLVAPDSLPTGLSLISWAAVSISHSSLSGCLRGGGRGTRTGCMSRLLAGWFNLFQTHWSPWQTYELISKAGTSVHTPCSWWGLGASPAMPVPSPWCQLP